MAGETENNEQNGGNGQTQSVMPTSTNNVTTRRLAQAMQALWSKTDTAKADKITPQTAGNLAELDSNGNLADSGKSVEDFATAAEGTLASTAVQSVKIGSSSGTELNNNTSVVLPLAIAQGEANPTAGLISAQDQKKLNEIAPGAQVNQNAFSKVNVATTTGTVVVAASSNDPTQAGAAMSMSAANGSHIQLAANSTDRTITISDTLSSKTAVEGSSEESLVTRGEKFAWNNPQNSITWNGTYDASTNPGATVSTVTGAIEALDGGTITGLGSANTITTLTETDGQVSATAVPIQIAESQVTNLVDDLALKAPLASPALTGTPTAPTAQTGTNTAQIATTAFVNAEIASKMEESDAMIYKGPIAGGSTGNYGAFTPAANKGWTYKVSANGKIDGHQVFVGDMLICNTDNTPAPNPDGSDYQTIWAKWDYYPGNTDGAVIGPDSSTANTVAGYADTSGKLIKVLSEAEVKAAAGLSNVVNTGDSDIPEYGGTTKFTTGGAYTALALKADKSTAVTSVDYDTTNKKITKTINGTTTDVVTVAQLQSDMNLSGKEDKSNKVTTVRAAASATNDAYPSELAVRNELDTKVDKVSGKGLSTNDYTTEEKNKLHDIAEGAEVNQNAYSNVKVGNTTVAAASKTDTIEFVGDGSTTVTASIANKSVTISSTDEKVKATAKSDSVAYPLLAASSASPISGNPTDAIYDTGVTLTPSTNTITANISGDAATASAAKSGSALENAINSKASGDHTHKVKINGTVKTITAPGTAEANVTDLGTYLTSSDIAGKADKDTDAVEGNFASFDSSGNPVDSGTKASDFKTIQDAVTDADATTSGTTTTFVDSVTQDTNGEITVHKKTVPTATVSANNTGIVTLTGSIGATVSSENNKAATEKAVRDAVDTLKANTVNNVSWDSTNKKITKTIGSTTSDVVTAADINYESKNVAGASASATANAAVTGTTGVFFNHVENGVVTSSHKFIGSGTAKVTSDANGVITINGSEYTDVKLGFGNATATSSSSGVYTASITNFTLDGGNGGIVGIKFTSDVPANSTLNITGTGAKNIKYRGSNIGANVIQNGDTAYFQYDGTNYILFATDRSVGETTEQEIQDIIDALT